MSYTDTNGSIVLPSGAIVPYANLSAYGNPAPSGFLFADGYYWDITKYPTLFAAIGYTYGRVDQATTNPVTFNSQGNVITFPCFRTPNLMNKNYGYSYFNTSTQQTISYPAVNYTPGISYTTVAGDVQSATVNTTNTVTLTTDQLPAHSHSITDPGHVHSINETNTGPGGNSGIQYYSDEFVTGYTSTYGAYTGIEGTNNTGSGTAVTLPTVPSFVMPYLIKL